MTLPQTQIAAVLPETGPSPTAQLEIKHDRPVPVAGKGEFLVKLEYSGVCHSDVHSIRGDTPMSTVVAGHEGVGTVVAGRYCQVHILLTREIVADADAVGASVNEGCVGRRVGIR